MLEKEWNTLRDLPIVERLKQLQTRIDQEVLG